MHISWTRNEGQGGIAMGRRRVFDGRRMLIGLLMMVSIYGLACRNALCAVESDSLSIGALKHLSIEELMNLDVTSVSKQPEPYGRAPAAIQVITQNEIRRSGRIEHSGSAAAGGQSGRGAEEFPRLGHQRARIQHGSRQQASGHDRRPHGLYAALLRRFLGRRRIICWRTSIASKSSAAPAARSGAPMPSTASSTSPARAPRTPRGFIWRAAAEGRN